MPFNNLKNLFKTFLSINVDFENSLSILVFAKNNLLKC